MNSNKVATLKDYVEQSHAGTLSFGDLVGQLIAMGIERYHADYSRMELTYYLPSGETCVLPMPCASDAIANEFSASEVAGCVRQSQLGQLKYPQFIEKTIAAGCVGYFVQIAGKRVQYFGRHGDIHTEWFPDAAKT